MSKSAATRRAGLLALVGIAATTTAIACADSTAPREGTVVVRLTDAPLDSVRSVNVWVVRIDAKAATTDSADAAANPDSTSRGGWTTIARPDAVFDLLALRTDTATVGVTRLPAGTWRGVRIVIDPARSFVVLKDGTELNGRTNLAATGEPGIRFPSAATSGIKVNLSRPLRIDGDTTVLTVDFDAGASFVARGTSATQGFIFRPVVKATVTGD